eukprot:gene2152-2348_t
MPVRSAYFFFVFSCLVFIHVSISYRVVKSVSDDELLAWESSLTDDLSSLSTQQRLLSSHRQQQKNHRLQQEKDLGETEDHRVRGLPGLPSDGWEPVHYAGHIPVDSARGGYFFYWLFEAEEDAMNKPLLIWLNGGPGCSSMDGLWLELGPFRLSSDGKVVSRNPYSWHSVANLLFIDQPVGTGLSYTTSKDGHARNDEIVNAHFTTFLVNFFKRYPSFVKEQKQDGKNGKVKKITRPIIFAGESHAGHYIPSLVAHLLNINKGGGINGLMISIEGLALGNPWIDPALQYNPGDFARGLGLISQGQSNRLKQQELVCHQHLSKGSFYHKTCIDLLDQVVDGSSLHGSSKVLVYDARRFVSAPKAFPPGHDILEAYLNRADVRAAIHASTTSHRYVECADPPYFALIQQDGKGVVRELEAVLESQIRVLVYSGQYDLVCSHVNTEEALDRLTWEGSNGWLHASRGVWLVDKQPVAYLRSHENLASLLVLDAGHMVPMDQPALSLRMISAFIQRKPLQDGLSPLGVADPIRQECSSRHLFAPLSDVSNGNFAPVIAHSYPLQDGIQIRLRLQHLTHLTDLTIERALLRVEPGSYLIPLNELVFNSSHASVEVKLTGLIPGQKYTLQVERMNKDSTVSHRLTRRTHEVTVGCYRPGFSQCCHHGVCEAHADGPKCQCDPGYSGEFCNRYVVNSYKSTDNTTLSSGDSGQCTVHLQPVAIEWDVKSLPSPSLLLRHALSSICNTTEAKQDCCLEIEAGMAISSGLAEHWSATAALLEHDLAAALRQSSTIVRVLTILDRRGSQRIWSSIARSIVSSEKRSGFEQTTCSRAPPPSQWNIGQSSAKQKHTIL